MKLYFTKYLPIGGEIREGDKAIDKNIHHPNNIVTLSFDKYGNASDGRGVYSSDGLKKLKKVKLFLCSRDIQVGDEVQLYKEGFKLGEKVVIKTKDNLNLAKMAMGFRVIGEISPEAKWVKEGDEFDKDEVTICWYKGDKFWLYFQNWEVPRTEGEYHIVCKIKCDKCETFH
jgi:hypothetical protein